jgi:uncharacterized protein YhfF
VTASADWRTLKQFQFGDSPELADRLAALVIAGVKTATCSAVSEVMDTSIGEQQVVLSGGGVPVAVIETVTLDVLPLANVTPAQAALEGEGDLSHSSWLDAHTDYFTREGTYAPDMQVIFETFRLVETLDDDFAARANEHVQAERAEAQAAGYKALGAVA